MSPSNEENSSSEGSCQVTGKDISENPDKVLSPSKNDAKQSVTAAPTAELDVNAENEGKPIGSTSPDAESKANEADKTEETPAAETDTATSSKSPAGETNRDTTAVDASEEKAAVVEAPKKRTRKKWKKPVGKPNRPLSAYNLYFRKERALMLGDAIEKTDQEQGKKRVHRKTHGKIGFAEMARIIGAKWKKLPDEEKEEFVKVAVVEKEKYAKDLANWREEQKKKTIDNSMGPGRKSKISKGSGFGNDDDLVQSIAEDREKLLRQHQAFRMQMMQEMQVGHLGPLPGEGQGRQMPTIEYLRNMQDDRTRQFFGKNRNGASSSLFTQYPSAAEGSGRDLYQQMMAMTSGPDGQGSEPDQLRQFKMARMQMNSMTDGPGGPSMGGTMGIMGGSMGGSMGSNMSNQMMGNQMGSNSMGGNMGNAMGMIPMNNGAPQAHYEMERFQHMRYQNQMHGMNNNHFPARAKGQRWPSEMAPHDGRNNNNMEAAMMRFQQQNRYN